jgi:hypothetical protein
MRISYFLMAILVAACAQPQYFDRDRNERGRSDRSEERARYERNFERCMERQVDGQRVTRDEMRDLREACEQRAADRTDRQERREAERDRPVLVPERPMPVQPLDPYRRN